MGSTNYPKKDQLGDLSDFMMLAHLVAFYAEQPASYDIYPALGAVGANPFIALCSKGGRQVPKLLHIGFSDECLLSKADGVQYLQSNSPTLKDFFTTCPRDAAPPSTASIILPDATYLLVVLRLLSEALGAEVRFLHSSESRQILQVTHLGEPKTDERPTLSAIAQTYVKELNGECLYPLFGSDGDSFFLEMCGWSQIGNLVALRTIEIQLIDVDALLRYLGDDEDAHELMCALSPSPSNFLKRRQVQFSEYRDSRINLECLENMIELCASMSEVFDTTIELSKPNFPDWKEALMLACRHPAK